MDEINLDEIEKDINSKNTVEERVRNLVKDKKEAVEKAAQEAKARAEAEEKAKVAEQEAKFYASFSDSVVKYPQAAEFKDKIKEKVLAGYSPEDATISILHSEGRLAPMQDKKVESFQGNFAGGSAPTQIQNGNKSPSQMTQAERLEELRKAEARGDLSMS